MSGVLDSEARTWFNESMSNTTTVQGLAAVFAAEYERDTHTSALDLAQVARRVMPEAEGFTDNDVEDLADQLFDRQCYGDTLEELARLVLEQWT